MNIWVRTPFMRETMKLVWNMRQREIEIADRLHSRERRAWVHCYSAQCRLFLGQIEQAEQEFLDGIKLAESIGENRALSLY